MENNTYDPFEQTIKDYLDDRATKDPLFRPVYEQEGKSIKECAKFIYGQVKESGRTGFNDEEIYGMAVHYYQEKVEVSDVSKPDVIINRSIELTDEEKEQLRQRLVEEAIERERRSLAAGKAKKKLTIEPKDLPTLF